MALLVCDNERGEGNFDCFMTWLVAPESPKTQHEFE